MKFIQGYQKKTHYKLHTLIVMILIINLCFIMLMPSTCDLLTRISLIDALGKLMSSNLWLIILMFSDYDFIILKTTWPNLSLMVFTCLCQGVHLSLVQCFLPFVRLIAYICQGVVLSKNIVQFFVSHYPVLVVILSVPQSCTHKVLNGTDLFVKFNLFPSKV